MAVAGVLLRRAALCTRHHLHLPCCAAPCHRYRRRPKNILFLRYQNQTGREGGSRSLSRRKLDTGRVGRTKSLPRWDVRNRYLVTPCDLQQLVEQHSKGDARVLPLITEEIVFRRLVRLSKRSIGNSSSLGMGYYLAVGCGLTDVIPTSKVEDEKLLHPQFRRIIHHFRFIEVQSTKEAVVEAGEDATKWKDILREVRPSCYDLLSSSLKRTLVYVCVELGEMCERGEMKGEDAYDLLKHIVKDMEENMEDEWSRYKTSYIV